MNGDFSGHEFTLPPEMRERYKAFIQFADPVSEEIQTIRSNLIDSVNAPYHIYKGTVYQPIKGQGSGTGLTADYSSFCSWCFMRTLWRYLELPDKEFTENVELAIQGDDTENGVSDDAPTYNMLSAYEYSREIGMYYTSGSKTTVSAPYSRLSEDEFLKRKFVALGPRMSLAPLRLSSIYESLMYEHKSANNEDRANTLRSALIEMRHHGKAKYDELLSIVTRYARRRMIFSPFPSFSEQFQRLCREHEESNPLQSAASGRIAATLLA
jgi:hypothetical protein